MTVTFQLFELLPEDERQREISKLKMEKYRAGQIIYERGGPCMDVFFIFEGLIRFDSSTSSGDVVFSHYRRPGAVVGWWAAVSGKSQPLTGTAAEDVLVGRSRQADFMTLILSHRDLSEWMLRYATTQLVAEVDRIRYMTVLAADKRVAAGLLEYSNNSGSHVIQVPERVELASRLGMTRETLSRILSNLQKRGIIAFEGEKIRILDMKQLTEAIW